MYDPSRLPLRDLESRKFEKAEIDKSLRMNVIEPAKSEWALLIVFAPKKDGSLCFCTDHRKLTGVTFRNAYPIPRMNRFLDF